MWSKKIQITSETDIKAPTEVTSTAASQGDPVTPKQNTFVVYTVAETPPWPLCIFLGFQHCLTAFGAIVSVPLLLQGALCMNGDPLAVSYLEGTIFVVSGIATLLQTTFGIRLPILQGSTFGFLVPTFAILSLPRWKCPAPDVLTSDNDVNVTFTTTTTPNMSFGTATSEDSQEIWQSRIREIQGAIMVASLFQVVVGFSGIMTFVLRLISPLVVTPTIALVGLSLFDVAADKASKQWWIALLTMALIVLFSQCLYRISVPAFWPTYVRGKGCVVQRTSLQIFELFPVLLGMGISWLLCYILTVTNVLPSEEDRWGHFARTDTKSSVLEKAEWIRVPYPGQWGLPTVSTGAVFGMLAGVLASMIESVGDYYACARLSDAPPPPPHAINRAIGMEGIACILAGAFGSGNGTTSFSENVAAIGITKVASRRVVQTAGLLMVILGCVGKVGAFFVALPDPVVGGMFLCMFSMIAAVGLSNIQYVDLNKSRNLCVFGMSIFLGLAIPRWVGSNSDAIDTGSEVADQIISVLLSTNMFVGGFVAFVLDNLLPGTLEERGITRWRHDASSSNKESGKLGVDAVYRVPLFSPCIDRAPACGKLPFCPAARIAQSGPESGTETNTYYAEDSTQQATRV